MSQNEQEFDPDKFKLSIEEIGYLEEIRKRMGISPESSSKDKEILAIPPLQRVQMILAWNGGTANVLIFKNYCESQGIYLTLNPEDPGIIHND